jgi:Recombination endonuclease VII
LPSAVERRHGLARGLTGSTSIIAILAASRPARVASACLAFGAHDPGRQTSWTGRSVSPRGKWDKKLYAEDPFYRYLSLTRRRGHRTARKEFDNAHRRRRRATDADYRDKERARRYGLSLQDYRVILARQGNACAICKKSDKRLCIDHCHATGKVRGFLCRACNLGLGNYNDDPALMRAAMAYLEASRR